MKEFSCIGPECADSCCVGWTINVDKKTYLKYKNSRKKSEFHEFLINNVRKMRNSKSVSTYAETLKCESGRCAFLDEDDLCLIHKNLGHDMLSSTCQTYPRFYYEIGGKNIIASHLSCPEIARLVLLNEKGIDFETGIIEINPNAYFTVINSEPTSADYSISKYYLDVLNTIIYIIKNRKFSIEKRLMIMGMFVSKIKKASLNEIKDIINNFNNPNYLGIYSDELESINSYHYAQLKTIISLSAKSGLDSSSDSQLVYSLYKADAVKYIFENVEHDEEAIQRYENEALKLYNNFVGRKGYYIMENYILNTIIERHFPIDGEKDILLSYIKIVIEFVMLRTIISGLLLNDANMDTDTIVDIVQHHSRSMVHNQRAVDNFIEFLKEENYYSLAGAFILINI